MYHSYRPTLEESARMAAENSTAYGAYAFYVATVGKMLGGISSPKPSGEVVKAINFPSQGRKRPVCLNPNGGMSSFFNYRSTIIVSYDEICLATENSFSRLEPDLYSVLGFGLGGWCARKSPARSFFFMHQTPCLCSPGCFLL